MTTGRIGNRDFSSSTESITYSIMQNEDNERNINHNNRGENEGKKLNIVENRVQNSRRQNSEK